MTDLIKKNTIPESYLNPKDHVQMMGPFVDHNDDLWASHPCTNESLVRKPISDYANLRVAEQKSIECVHLMNGNDSETARLSSQS